MTNPNAAESQLERILYILPAAAKPEGVALDELAAALGVSIDQVVRDINLVTAREYYHPAGSSDAFGVLLQGDRVKVNAHGEYDRPVRLNAAEAMAVEIGLRILALEGSSEDAARIHALAHRMQSALAAPAIMTTHDLRESRGPIHGHAAGYDAEYDVEYDVDDTELLLALGTDELRGVFADAIAEGKGCVIDYLKPGDSAPARRRTVPQRLLYNDGFWYVLAFDQGRDGMRFFRLDRVLDASICDIDDTAAQAVEAARAIAEPAMPYHAEDDVEVTVEYSANIARWIAEKTGARPDEDGTIVLRHRIADPRWLVRHVLQYAGDAVVRDRDYRAVVRDAASRIAS